MPAQDQNEIETDLRHLWSFQPHISGLEPSLQAWVEISSKSITSLFILDFKGSRQAKEPAR